MAVLNPGDASKQMKETCEDLVALDAAHKIMEGDQTITAALAVAEYRMQIAAVNYINSCSPQQVAQPPAVRAPHRNQGGQAEQRPYSRSDVRPPSSGVSGQVAPGGVGLPIAPLNTNPPPQAPPVNRVPAVGHVQTAPGLPDAVVPQGAQLHPRTVARIQQVASDRAELRSTEPSPSPPPSPAPGWGPLPDLPLMPPPAPYPGAPPPTALSQGRDPPTCVATVPHPLPTSHPEGCATLRNPWGFFFSSRCRWKARNPAEFLEELFPAVDAGNRPGSPPGRSPGGRVPGALGRPLRASRARQRACYPPPLCRPNPPGEGERRYAVGWEATHRTNPDRNP